MAVDIGQIIFVEILGMTMYPGSPFTGNIYRDLIMFLIVPSIFIIIVIYSMTGRILADAKLRMLLGVGAYLFTIAGGYYSAFALLSGPYFIFLIFVMGILYFIIGHFTGRPPRPAVGGGGGYSRGGNYASKLNPVNRRKINEEIKKLQKDLAVAEVQLAEDRKGGHDRAIQDAQAEVRQIKKAIRELQDELDLA